MIDRESIMSKYTEYNAGRIKELFASALGDEGREKASLLINSYSSIDEIYSAEYGELERLVGKRCATFIKVLASVASRRVTDSFKMGIPHTMTEISEYFSALLLAQSVEVVYAMLLSAEDNVIDVRKISTGTVNASDVMIRKIVEPAVSLGASKIILAHNHPGGSANPSKEDAMLAAEISETLKYVGLKLEFLLTVAGSDSCVMSASDPTETEK